MQTLFTEHTLLFCWCQKLPLQYTLSVFCKQCESETSNNIYTLKGIKEDSYSQVRYEIQTFKKKKKV